MLELPVGAAEEKLNRDDMLATILISLLASMTAQDDLQARCEAFQAEYGGESDCACLAEMYENDDELAAAFDMIEGPEDLESAPDIVTEAIEACS
ncbi:MAG: hypothetical protein V2I43_17965 [Parvularcula sp.]|nr:hypothetical protein [Parvularcula sp.]